MKHREIVERHWEWIIVRERDDHQWEWLGSLRWGATPCVEDSEDACWRAAAEFTKDRLEEIRQLEREIEWAEKQLYPWNRQTFDLLIAVWSVREECAIYRILSRLESALVGKRMGMKK